MKFSSSKLTGTVLITAFLVLAHSQRAFSQDSTPEKSQALQDTSSEQSQALLQKVKQSQMERRIAIKQTEIDRLKEDLDKSKKDLDASQKNLDTTATLITTSNANMDELAAERKRLEQQLDLTDLRIEAEQKEGEGLKRLSSAQSSEVDAINQRMAEIDVRSRVRELEVQLLSAGKPVPGEDNDERGTADLYNLQKTLASDEVKTVSGEAIARAAMKAASARLELAQEAAARVKQVSEGMTQPSPAPVAEKTGETTPGSKPAASPTPRLHRKHIAPSQPVVVSKPAGSPTPKPTPKKA